MYTKHAHVRGAWYILKLCKDGKLRFKILTRKVFKKVFKADCMNVTVAFKQPVFDSNGKYIGSELVNYTYRCIVLPPVQSFYEDSDSEKVYIGFNDTEGRVNKEIGSWAKNTMQDSETGSTNAITIGLILSVIKLSKAIDNGVLTIGTGSRKTQTPVEGPPNTKQPSEEKSVKVVKRM